jgi:hypothetical protein
MAIQLIARSTKWNNSMEETFHLFKTKQKSGSPSSKVAKKPKKYQISSILYNEYN